MRVVEGRIIPGVLVKFLNIVVRLRFVRGRRMITAEQRTTMVTKIGEGTVTRRRRGRVKVIMTARELLRTVAVLMGATRRGRRRATVSMVARVMIMMNPLRFVGGREKDGFVGQELAVDYIQLGRDIINIILTKESAQPQKR